MSLQPVPPTLLFPAVQRVWLIQTLLLLVGRETLLPAAQPVRPRDQVSPRGLPTNSSRPAPPDLSEPLSPSPSDMVNN